MTLAFSKGFIQGVKMALPIGFERKDDRKFEQITIPAASGGSVDDIVKKLVPIAELDPIGQVAFKVSFYIKAFSRIQMYRN